MKSIFNFNVFSRRQKANANSNPEPPPITDTFRNRVFILCRDTFSGVHSGNYTAEFWEQIHHKLQYLHGTPLLVPESNPKNAVEDVLTFLQACESDHFLDFLEYIFQVESYWRVSDKATEMVDMINTFFEIDTLPYALTQYVITREQDGYFSREKISAYPRVILREHEFVHQELVQPALSLLSDPAFTAANSEFLEALEDYRKRDFGDCLTKCCSALESVMKVICDRKGWQVNSNDTAAALLRRVIKESNLDPFLEQPLLMIATIRNRLSKSHGAGLQPRSVAPDIARFALNATATAILFLSERTK